MAARETKTCSGCHPHATSVRAGRLQGTSGVKLHQMMYDIVHHASGAPDWAVGKRQLEDAELLGLRTGRLLA